MKIHSIVRKKTLALLMTVFLVVTLTVTNGCMQLHGLMVGRTQEGRTASPPRSVSAPLVQERIATYLRCSQLLSSHQQNSQSRIIELTLKKGANPTQMDLCQARLGFYRGAVVTFTGGTIAQFSKVLGMKLPQVEVSDGVLGVIKTNADSEHAIDQTAIEAAVRRVMPSNSASQKPINSASELTYFGVYKNPAGGANIYMAFTPKKLETRGAQALHRWVEKQIADPPACTIASPQSSPSQFGSSWSCYFELEVQNWTDLQSGPNGLSVGGVNPGPETFTLLSDLWRQNENGAVNSNGVAVDRYLITAQWETNTNGSCNLPNFPALFASASCGPYIVSRSISIPLATNDTQPPSFYQNYYLPPPATGISQFPPGVTLVDHGPSTTEGTKGQQVSDTVGANFSLSPGGTVGAGFTQSWSSPDVNISDNTNINTFNQPGYPAQTASWVEHFMTPSYGIDATNDLAAAPDGMSDFKEAGGEAAAFEVTEGQQPFQLSVFGFAQDQLDNIAWVPTPLLGFILAGNVPVVSSKIGIVSVAITWTVQPPEFDVCTSISLGLTGASNCSSYNNSQQLSVVAPMVTPTGSGQILIYGLEDNYGQPVNWTMSAQGTQLFSPTLVSGPVSNPSSPDFGNGCILPYLCLVNFTPLSTDKPGTSQFFTVQTQPPMEAEGPQISIQVIAGTSPPNVTSVTPASEVRLLWSEYGTVDIQGTGFTGATAVLFDTVALAICPVGTVPSSANPCFTVNSDTDITAMPPQQLTWPNGAPSLQVDVQVVGGATAGGAWSLKNLGDEFTYIAITRPGGPKCHPICTP